MNIYDDDQDSDDIVCEYCGHRTQRDVGGYYHTCKGSKEAFKKKNEEYEKRFKGKGKCKGVLVIEYECFNSEEAFNNLMDLVSLGDGLELGEHQGIDKLMEVKWRTIHKRGKA